MPDLLPSEALRAQGADEAAALIRAFCDPLLPPEEAEDFGKFFDRFADAKVVLLGEATSRHITILPLSLRKTLSGLRIEWPEKILTDNFSAEWKISHRRD